VAVTRQVASIASETRILRTTSAITARPGFVLTTNWLINRPENHRGGVASGFVAAPSGCSYESRSLPNENRSQPDPKNHCYGINWLDGQVAGNRPVQPNHD
jgi:hypothetical protein